MSEGHQPMVVGQIEQVDERCPRGLLVGRHKIVQGNEGAAALKQPDRVFGLRYPDGDLAPGDAGILPSLLRRRRKGFY